MRYRFTEFAPSGKRQYFVALGVKDIEILKGLAGKACSAMPALQERENPEYHEVYNRLRSMNRALAEALLEAEQYGDDGTRRRLPNQPKPDAAMFTAEDIVNDEFSENEA